MATGTSVASSQAQVGESFVAKFGPHAPKIMIGAAVLGLISVFLPAVTITIFGLTETVSVGRDWRGKLCFVGYVAVGVMAGMMLKGELAAARKKIIACLATAGVCLLLAVWLPMTLSNVMFADAIRVGFGNYVNIFAAALLTAAAALQAKRAGVF